MMTLSSTKPINVDELLAQMRVLASQADSHPVERAGADGESFASALGQAINEVNNSQIDARQLADAYQAGTTDASLAEVMVTMQKASLSFQALTQVRNKLVSAYQEIMGMQV